MGGPARLVVGELMVDALLNEDGCSCCWRLGLDGARRLAAACAVVVVTNGDSVPYSDSSNTTGALRLRSPLPLLASLLTAAAVGGGGEDGEDAFAALLPPLLVALVL